MQESYSSSSALVFGELMKLVFSVGMISVDDSPTSAPAHLFDRLQWLLANSLPLMVPAVIYLIMNMLSFVALARVHASTFAVISQTKILTTAVFSVTLLGRQIHPRKWRALLLICIAAVLVTTGGMVNSGGTVNCNNAPKMLQQMDQHPSLKQFILSPAKRVTPTTPRQPLTE